MKEMNQKFNLIQESRTYAKYIVRELPESLRAMYSKLCARKRRIGQNAVSVKSANLIRLVYKFRVIYVPHEQVKAGYSLRR